MIALGSAICSGVSRSQQEEQLVGRTPHDIPVSEAGRSVGFVVVGYRIIGNGLVSDRSTK